MAHHDRNGRSTILRSHVVQRRSIAPEPRFRTAQNRPRDRVDLGKSNLCKDHSRHRADKDRRRSHKRKLENPQELPSDPPKRSMGWRSKIRADRVIAKMATDKAI